MRRIAKLSIAALAIGLMASTSVAQPAGPMGPNGSFRFENTLQDQIDQILSMPQIERPDITILEDADGQIRLEDPERTDEEETEALFRQFFDPYFQPADPGLAGGDIVTYAVPRIAEFCFKTGTANIIRCNQARRFQATGQALQSGNSLFPNCASAASGFLPYYSGGTPSPLIARNYDMGCLGSFSARKEDPLSEALRSDTMKARRAQSVRLLDAIAILSADGKERCGGLLYDKKYFVTARHCLLETTGAALTISAGNGSFQNLPVSLTGPGAEAGSEVQRDWTVFTILDPGAVNFPEVRLEKLRSPAEVNVVTYYPFFENTDYAAGQSGFLNQFRFQNPNMCQALQSSGGCLQLVCQTIRGFSGSPIFKANQDQGPLTVYGFVSGSFKQGSSCASTIPVDGTTMAVSAEQISTGG